MGKIKHLRHTKRTPKRRKDGVRQRYWTGKKKGEGKYVAYGVWKGQKRKLGEFSTRAEAETFTGIEGTQIPMDHPEGTKFVVEKKGVSDTRKNSASRTIISMRMPKSKGEARDRAMEFQRLQSVDSMSWGEAAEYSHFFERVGKKFGLTEEFKENGII